MSVFPSIGASADEMLFLAMENTELRLQLAEAQEQCIEMAVDAGELQAEIEALRAQLAALRTAQPNDALEQDGCRVAA